MKSNLTHNQNTISYLSFIAKLFLKRRKHFFCIFATLTNKSLEYYFMKIYKSLLLIIAALMLFSCTGKKVEKSEYPMFWTWYNYRTNPERTAEQESEFMDSVFNVMNETGLDGVILNAKTLDDYRKAIPIANSHGLEVYSWWWGMNLEHDRDSILNTHPEWFSVNRLGQSLGDRNNMAYVDYYRFLCPALPEVREYLKGKFTELCKIEGLNAIVIDYTRFVDVILPTTLWPRYGIVQDREYAEWDYGYHPYIIEKFMKAHGYDPRELEDPSTDDLWRQFRCDQVTELVNELAEIAHSFGKKMSASPFPTPAMSRRMVRQDWGNWNLDIVFPMIYKNFYTYDVSFISDCTIENVKTANPKTTVFAGLTALNDHEMFESMDAAFDHGAKGICLFTIGSLRDPEIRAQFKVYADNKRAERAAGKLVATGPTKVDTNPFNKTVIMDFINHRIAAYTSVAKAASLPELKKIDRATIEAVTGNALQAPTKEEYFNRLKAVTAPNRRNPGNPEWQPIVDVLVNNFCDDIKLGEYKLDREFGTTQYYTVTEENTGIVFHVDFYLYGDLVSGWDVKPQEESLKQFLNKK
jgi:hypothetical protein